MKRFIYLLSLLLLLIMPGTVLAQANADDVEAVRQFIQDNFDAQYLLEDAVFYDNAYGITYEGADEIQQGVSPFYDRELFGDYDIEITDISSPNPGRVVAEMRYNPEGAQSPLDVRGVFTLANQQIVYAKLYYDPTVLISEYDYQPPADANNRYGLTESMIEEIEANPTSYYGETVTVAGLIEDFISGDALVLQDTAPFDFSPGTFVVVGNEDNFFENTPADVAQQVQITGTLTQLDTDAINEATGYEPNLGDLSTFGEDSFALVATDIETANPLGGIENAPLLGTRLVPDTIEEPDVTIDPSTYFGDILTLNGTITEITSPSTFVMEDTFPQDLTGGDIVVYTEAESFEAMNVEIEAGMMVRVTGQFLGMDVETIEGELGREIDTALLGDFDEDDYAVIASSVYQAEEDHYEESGTLSTDDE